MYGTASWSVLTVAEPTRRARDSPASSKTDSKTRPSGVCVWLTTGPASDYELTRAWAAAIRDWAPWCGGLTWRSHREPEGFAYVLFEDRVPDECLAEVSTGVPLTGEDQRLDDGIGRLYLERILETYRVALI